MRGTSGDGVNGYQASVGLGALVEVVDNRLWLGVSYHSQPGFGPMTQHGTLEVRYQGSGGAPLPVTFTQAGKYTLWLGLVNLGLEKRL